MASLTNSHPEDADGEATRDSAPPATNFDGSVGSARPMSAREQMIALQRDRLRAGAGASDTIRQSAGMPDTSGPPIELVLAVLGDFAQTDYAMQICEYCDVSPTVRGTVRAIFEEARMQGTTLVVRLDRQCEQRAEKIFDRLKRHLRERMPGQVKRVQYETKSPPAIKTYIV